VVIAWVDMHFAWHVDCSMVACHGPIGPKSKGLHEFRHSLGSAAMKPHLIVGLLLIVLGVLALSVHSVTYFTTDHEVGPLGFFVWDVAHPNTIFFNPIAGIVAMTVGIFLLFNARRRPI
jgi:membrane-bound ClpP family serine protease